MVWGDAREMIVFGYPPSHTFRKAFPLACVDRYEGGFAEGCPGELGQLVRER